jgi:hypothetical protein
MSNANSYSYLGQELNFSALGQVQNSFYTNPGQLPDLGLIKQIPNSFYNNPGQQPNLGLIGKTPNFVYTQIQESNVTAGQVSNIQNPQVSNFPYITGQIQNSFYTNPSPNQGYLSQYLNSTCTRLSFPQMEPIPSISSTTSLFDGVVEEIKAKPDFICSSCDKYIEIENRDFICEKNHKFCQFCVVNFIKKAISQNWKIICGLCNLEIKVKRENLQKLSELEPFKTFLCHFPSNENTIPVSLQDLQQKLSPQPFFNPPLQSPSSSLLNPLQNSSPPPQINCPYRVLDSQPDIIKPPFNLSPIPKMHNNFKDLIPTFEEPKKKKIENNNNVIEDVFSKQKINYTKNQLSCYIEGISMRVNFGQ